MNQFVSVKSTQPHLFPQEFIDYHLKYKSKQEEDGIIVSCAGQMDPSWDDNAMRNAYINNYSKLLQKDFDYRFHMEAQYTYERNGTLKQGVAYIKEQTNESFFYISQYTFTLMKPAPSHQNEAT